MPRFRWAAVGLALIAVVSRVPDAAAQAVTLGAIEGTISDETGAKMPGVAATLTSPASRQPRATRTAISPRLAISTLCIPAVYVPGQICKRPYARRVSSRPRVRLPRHSGPVAGHQAGKSISQPPSGR